MHFIDRVGSILAMVSKTFSFWRHWQFEIADMASNQCWPLFQK